MAVWVGCWAAAVAVRNGSTIVAVASTGSAVGGNVMILNKAVIVALGVGPSVVGATSSPGRLHANAATNRANKAVIIATLFFILSSKLRIHAFR